MNENIEGSPHSRILGLNNCYAFLNNKSLSKLKVGT
jgi:hypothetical protein